MLGETTTAEITRSVNAQVFTENAAIAGGEIAGRAREDVERKIGKSVVTRKNFLEDSRQKKLQT
jgi:hypothetical protein